jgi:hypothetical protein
MMPSPITRLRNAEAALLADRNYPMPESTRQEVERSLREAGLWTRELGARERWELELRLRPASQTAGRTLTCFIAVRQGDDGRWVGQVLEEEFRIIPPIYKTRGQRSVSKWVAIRSARRAMHRLGGDYADQSYWVPVLEAKEGED